MCELECLVARAEAVRATVASVVPAERIASAMMARLLTLRPPPSTTSSTPKAGQAAQEALFPYFAQFVLEQYTDDIKAYRCGLTASW